MQLSPENTRLQKTLVGECQGKGDGYYCSSAAPHLVSLSKGDEMRQSRAKCDWSQPRICGW